MMDGGNGFTSWSLVFEKSSLPCLSPLPLYLPNQLAETKVLGILIIQAVFGAVKTFPILPLFIKSCLASL